MSALAPPQAAAAGATATVDSAPGGPPESLAAPATSLLYQRHRQRIFAYCLSRLGNRHDADDAVQNTFLYAHACLQRGVVPESELAWLYTIAHNVCRNRRRALWRRSRHETGVDLGALQHSLGRTEPADDELAGLSAALAAMPAKQRQALLLREWQGLSYREIGHTLALSQAAVETLLFRARRSLRHHLQQPSRGLALLFNGPVLLRLSRRLGHSSAGAKTAATLAAVGIAATAGVPLAHHPREATHRATAPPTTRRPSRQTPVQPRHADRAGPARSRSLPIRANAPITKHPRSTQTSLQRRAAALPSGPIEQPPGPRPANPPPDQRPAASSPQTAPQPLALPALQQQSQPPLAPPPLPPLPAAPSISVPQAPALSPPAQLPQPSQALPEAAPNAPETPTPPAPSPAPLP